MFDSGHVPANMFHRRCKSSERAADRRLLVLTGTSASVCFLTVSLLLTGHCVEARDFSRKLCRKKIDTDVISQIIFAELYFFKTNSGLY